MKRGKEGTEKISTRELPDFSNLVIKKEGGDQGVMLVICCGVKKRKVIQKKL